MSKKHTTLNASIIDTRRPTVAGADRHPGWHALRKIAARITTPLLPDDYLHLANPLWSARELRGRILGVAALDHRPGGAERRKTPRPCSSNRAGASVSTTSRANTSGSGCWSTGAGAGGRIR